MHTLSETEYAVYGLRGASSVSRARPWYMTTGLGVMLCSRMENEVMLPLGWLGKVQVKPTVVAVMVVIVGAATPAGAIGSDGKEAKFRPNAQQRA